MTTRNPTALTKRPIEDSALMPPPPPPKRQKRPKNVLDEDVYADALSHIIARDFFPGLLETEAQQEYMQALDSQNNDWIREAGRKLTAVMTPGPESRRRGRGTSFTPMGRRSAGETPRGFVGETPGRTPIAGGGSGADDFAPETEKPEVDVNMSLAAFQAKYTSEDNESFNELLDTQNEKRQGKYAFFHRGNKIRNAIAQRAEQQKLLPADRGGGESMALVRTNAQGEERQLVAGGGPSEDLSARPASVNSFPNRQGPRNSFMFGPESIEDSAHTHAQELQNRSNAPPRSVAYNSTRFPPPSATPSDTIPPSPSMSAIDAAIAGRPRPAESEPGYSGAETPRVGGYAFVDAEPTPSELGEPVDDEEAERAEREAVMKLLPKADESGPNPFSIQGRSAREGVHHRLVERADAVRRQEKGGSSSGVTRLGELGVTPRDGSGSATPGVRGTPRGVGGGAMTPAAQRLADTLRTPRSGALGNGSKGKVDWTSTPRVKRAT